MSSTLIDWAADIPMFVINVTFDCASPPRLAEFWSAVLGYEQVELREDFAELRNPDPRSVKKLIFYRVPEAKVVKNRVHIDLASRTPASDVERLTALGATVIGQGAGHGVTWTVMADPEGNEFCVG